RTRTAAGKRCGRCHFSGRGPYNGSGGDAGLGGVEREHPSGAGRARRSDLTAPRGLVRIEYSRNVSKGLGGRNAHDGADPVGRPRLSTTDLPQHLHPASHRGPRAPATNLTDPPERGRPEGGVHFLKPPVTAAAVLTNEFLGDNHAACPPPQGRTRN